MPQVRKRLQKGVQQVWAPVEDLIVEGHGTDELVFTSLLGLSEAESPIVPIVLGDSERTLLASRLLEDEGFLVVAIRPPTVPDGKARLRVTFTAAHKDEDIARLAESICTRILEAADAEASA